MEWITTIRDTFIIERNNAECIVYPLKAAIMGCFYTDMFLPSFHNLNIQMEVLLFSAIAGQLMNSHGFLRIP